MMLSKPLWGLLLVITQFVGTKSYCQKPAYTIVKNLPLSDWSGKEKGGLLTDEKKLELLKMLPAGKRVEFEYDFDEEEEKAYRPLNLAGIYFLDLDFDGDLDLLYSAINGSMAQSATRVYYNRDNVLEYYSTLRDGILDIKKNKDSYSIYTIFSPCCDSYTSRIDQYIFSSKDTAIFEESISIIGRSYQQIQGMPDFKTVETAVINHPSIYALPTDFRNTHPYFRKRNKEVRDILRAKNVVQLIKIEGRIKIAILSQENYKEEEYLLILTEPLANLPRMPVSLYEWSAGSGRRLIGWVKSVDVKK